MARSRHRSVDYDLDASVAVARVVADAGGDATPAAIAAALGYRGTNNGAFRSRLASARRFGLVTGRGERVLLSERGAAALSGPGPASAAARAAAFWAVPLFRAVAESPAAAGLPDAGALAALLAADHGVPGGRARADAARLLASAAQAGLLQPGADGRPPLEVDGRDPRDTGRLPSNLLPPAVRFDRSPGTIERRRGPVASRRGGPTVGGRELVRPIGDDEGLWLDEPAGGPRGRRSRPRVGVVAAAVACMAVVGVPVGLVLSAGGSNVALPTPHAGQRATGRARLPSGPADRQVLSALGATTDAGSFDFTYDLSATGPTSSAGSGGSVKCQAGTACAAVGRSGAGRHGTVVSGNGTIDTDPYAMVASTSVGPTVRVDGTDYWEGGSGTGLAPSSGDTGPGTPLSSFTGLVEGTLGTRAGAVAMMAMASPTGFLDLYQSEVTGADVIGAATLEGTAVTRYNVTLDPTQVAATPGTTTEEVTTIDGALGVLRGQGLSTMTAQLSIDASGYIHQAISVITFVDGGSVTLTTTLSDFGCAGTVLVPGEGGTPTPPAGCTSPDTGAAPAAATAPTTTTVTTTTTASSATTVTTGASGAPGAVTTTTGAASTPATSGG